MQTEFSFQELHQLHSAVFTRIEKVKRMLELFNNEEDETLFELYSNEKHNLEQLHLKLLDYLNIKKN